MHLLAAPFLGLSAPVPGPAAGAGSCAPLVASRPPKSTLLAQGVPTLAQDAVPAGSMARFVGVLACLRARLAPLLAPPQFSSPRQITWHGAAAGAPLTPRLQGAGPAVASMQRPACCQMTHVRSRPQMCNDGGLLLLHVPCPPRCTL